MLTKYAYIEIIQKNSNIYADKICIHEKYSLISIINLKKFF